MMELHSAAEEILKSRGLRKLCEKLGINIRQYRLLLGLFSTLSDRLEFMGLTAGLNKAWGFYLVGSLLLSLVALAKPALPVYLLFMIGFTMFVLLWMLLMDAANSIRKTPFVAGGFSIRDFSLMHLFPHFLGLILAVSCMLIPYTAEPKGASIFINLPIGRLRPFVRGIYSSLWMIVAIFHLVLLGPCVWFWGVIQGVLFIFFSAALVSVYTALAILFVDGLPFANAFKPSRANAMLLVYPAAALPILFFAVIQWIVFHNMLLVLNVAIALVLLTYGIAHISLGRLESKVRINLTMLGFVPTEMFKELE